MRLIPLLLVLSLVGCTYDPTEGTLRYSVSSDAFTQVDNIYYDDESGGHNTGPIALPFELSLHVVGEKVGGDTNQAYLKVRIMPENNLTGGTVTTVTTYTTENGVVKGARSGNAMKSYESGVEVMQVVWTQTWSPEL